MGFLTPLTAVIAAALAVPALVSLYFLKLKRKRMVIPSTLLWQRAVQDLQVNAPFQKIKNNLLLWIQLLLLAALLIAMARPTKNALADPGERVVIVIDCSASMNATDAEDGKTRLEAAKERALRVVDNLDAGIGAGDGGSSSGGAMVIAYAHRAVVLQDFTTDLGRVRSAIRQIEPTDQRSHLDSAIAALEPYSSQATASQPIDVHVFTDGRNSRSTNRALSLSNAQLRYHRMAEPEDHGDNIAIVALSARRDLETPQFVQLYARLANFHNQPIKTNVTIRVDDSVLSVDRVTVPAFDPASDTPGEIDLATGFTRPGDALITVEHDHDDLLAADDTAYTVLAPARDLRVLIVSDKANTHLDRVVRSTGVKFLSRMTSGQFEAQDPARLRRGAWDDSDDAVASGSAGGGFDVLIFDRYAPDSPPLVNSLYFGAVPPLDGFDRRPTRSDSPPNEYITQWERGSDLLRGLELSGFPIRRPGRLVLPADAKILAIGREGAVMAELTRDAVRHVVVGFELAESKWPHHVSFPMFFDLALPALGLDGTDQDSGVAYRTGENAVVVNTAGLKTIAYEGPATLTGRAIGTTLTLDAFARAGLYETDAEVSGRHRRLAVNVLDTAESDPRVAEVLEVGTSATGGTAEAVEVRKEIWPWFVWGALALLLIEWMVYARRIHI